MKTKSIIISLATIAVIALFVAYRVGTKWYVNKTFSMTASTEATLGRMVEAYRDSLGQYPVSLQEAMNLQSETFDRVEDHSFVRDPFSKQGDPIRYIPLYDRATKQRVSYVLLSSGLDGKFNNTVSPSDTIYIDSWREDIPVYNFEHAAFLRWSEDAKFNPFQYFCKKDYIILIGSEATTVADE